MGLAAAVLTSAWQMAVFVAPLAGVLASIGWQRRPPSVEVHADPGVLRCFETEDVRLTVWASADDGTPVDVAVTGSSGLRCAVTPRPDGRTDVTASTDRWGRYPLRVHVSVPGRGGLFEGTATAEIADVFVFPLVPAEATALPRTELLDRLGTHITSRIGRGVEFGGIRTYVPGDHLRTVNWPVSARRGSLHVTERLSERAADVVVLVDTYDQPPGPATDATERTARGAVQVVQSALRGGDRAGVVALGGSPRWLPPDIGRRQFYRVLDAVLGAGAAYERSTGTLAPRASVPSGAIVVAFSTLLDTDFALALIDLCRLGHVVVAVDVLAGAPFGDDQDPLVHRMWSQQRSFMYRDMATVGVDVIAWPESSALDHVMHLVPDHRRRTSRRR
ncbi:DUF58 domain-containing protein [Mycolicibacterium sediminis]|uniref:DUF58 domain-containing protein n=1 Tax=Mycolicibacterium sediminis TaxID=1286180 RepID=A0A7I7QK31_9MYCO|nr:hypothetical protein MSEDJ_07790 [Mycolicibacterium sediminis]